MPRLTMTAVVVVLCHSWTALRTAERHMLITTVVYCFVAANPLFFPFYSEDVISMQLQEILLPFCFV